MRFVFIGGTKWVGPVTARLALGAGHEVVVAHSGEHEGPGAIYGIDDPQAREWPLVKRVQAGKRTLRLPAGGGTVFHRVSIDRVAAAIIAAADYGSDGFWACNAVDSYDWTYAGLAAEIASILGWEWEPEEVAYDEQYAHPFMLRRSLIVSDRRLREDLGVTGPDPREALRALVLHLAGHGPREGALYA